jgi:four helix bundle protein
MLLAREIYQVTTQFPNEEKFGLTSQMRRSAVSIPSNLAEGHARMGVNEFLHFVSIAMGSVAELETQVILSGDLGFVSSEQQSALMDQLATVGRMLRGLQRSLQCRKQK